MTPDAAAPAVPARRRRRVLVVGALAAMLVVGGALVVRARAVAASSVEGSWVVTDLRAADGRDLLPEERSQDVRLRFRDGRLDGVTLCNQVGGFYEQHGHDLRLGRVASTAAGCPGEVAVLPRLLEVRRTSGTRDRRRLVDADGRLVAVLERRTSAD